MFDENYFMYLIKTNPEKYASSLTFLPNKQLPIILQECSLESTRNGKQIINNEESEIVEFYVDLLIQQNFLPQEIAIVSPLPSQLTYIKQKLNRYANLKFAAASEYEHISQKIIIMSIGLSGSFTGVPKLSMEKVKIILNFIDSM